MGAKTVEHLGINIRFYFIIIINTVYDNKMNEMIKTRYTALTVESLYNNMIHMKKIVIP